MAVSPCRDTVSMAAQCHHGQGWRCSRADLQPWTDPQPPDRPTALDRPMAPRQTHIPRTDPKPWTDPWPCREEEAQPHLPAQLQPSITQHSSAEPSTAPTTQTSTTQHGPAQPSSNPPHFQPSPTHFQPSTARHGPVQPISSPVRHLSSPARFQLSPRAGRCRVGSQPSSCHCPQGLRCHRRSPAPVPLQGPLGGPAPCQPPSSGPGEQPRVAAQPWLQCPSWGQLCQGPGLRVPRGELGRQQSLASEVGAGGGREQEEQLKMEQQKPKEPQGLVRGPVATLLRVTHGTAGGSCGDGDKSGSPCPQQYLEVLVVPPGTAVGRGPPNPSSRILHGPSQGQRHPGHWRGQRQPP